MARKKALENMTYKELIEKGYTIFPPGILWKVIEGELRFDDNSTKSPDSWTKQPETSTTKKASQISNKHPLADFEIKDPEPGSKNPRVVRLGKFTSENKRLRLAVEEVLIKYFDISIVKGQESGVSSDLHEFVKRMPDHPNRTMILGILEGNVSES